MKKENENVNENERIKKVKESCMTDSMLNDTEGNSNKGKMSYEVVLHRK